MESIAIVGSGCRFPGGANTPSKLWELLQNPRDILSQIPNTRFNSQSFHHPDGLHHGASNVQHSYLLSEDFRHFDESFFNIKAVEAESMDPQHRILLETVYEALEAGGLTIEKLRGSDTAVFIGQMINDYNDHLVRDLDNLPTYFATGTSRAITSNRLSYFFDWHGPSSTVDTACSSSLVALHQAVQSLRSGECSMAVVGGVNLLLGPEWYIGESKLKMLSPESRSRMWDAAANGYARGEGIAAIVVKKLSDAVAAGDHIECVIRETGVNQDGRTQGITMPNHTAQTALIKDTYVRAGLDLNSVLDMPQFFEAHGTGTQAGDVKEAQAIHDAFSGVVASKDNHLFVGSIKTVIGHTEGTAGLAGLLKASLALQNAVIPPNMLFNRLNPTIEPFYGNLRILTESRPWPALPEGQPRRASVNSFGFGGTNAHAVLENYTSPNPKLAAEDANAKSSILPFIFSALSSSSLARTIEAYSIYLRSHPSTSLAELNYTLAVRRSQLPVRITFSANSAKMLSDEIDSRLKELQQTPGSALGMRASRSRLLGIFTGQGAQWSTMGKEMLRSSTLARESFDELEKSLAELPLNHRPSWSLCEEIMRDEPSSKISEAEIAQPACTAIQIVMIDLLRSLGVEFTAVVGHSSGEIAASYAAGYLSAKDAVRIAYYRGFYAKLSSGLNGQQGAMMAVAASYQEAKEFCHSSQMRGRLSVAASNSPTTVTISGDAEAIQEAKAIFDKRKVFARLLRVSTAYHSHHMLGCADSYIKALRECKVQIKMPSKSARCVWYSSVNEGAPITFTQELADIYWRDNMVKPVLFAQALQAALIGGHCNVVLEVGPHPALMGPAKQIIQSLAESKQIRESKITYCGTLVRGKNDAIAIADALGFLWTNGGSEVIKLEHAFHLSPQTQSRPKLIKGLPSYSWDHDQIHWKDSRLTKAFRLRENMPDELLGTLVSDGTEQELRWRNMIRPQELPWLSGHRLEGQIVFPAAGYASMAIQAAQALPAVRRGKVRLFEVLDLRIGRPITFDNELSSVETLFSINGMVSRMPADPKSDSLSYHANFSCYSSTNGGSTTMQLVASGRIRVEMGEGSASVLPQCNFESANADLRPVSEDAFYSGLENLGYEYSDDFRALSSIQRKLNVAAGALRSYPSQSLLIHPVTLDLAIQSALIAFCAPGDADLWALHVPTMVDRISVNPFLSTLQQRQQHFSDSNSNVLPFRTSLLENGPSDTIFGDVSVLTQENLHTWIQVEGLNMVPLSAATASDDRAIFAHTVWGVAHPISGWINNRRDLDCCAVKPAPVSDAVNTHHTALFQLSIEHLKSLIAELAHRYQSMHILEISSSDGEANPIVGSKLGVNFESYTVINDITSSTTRKHDIQEGGSNIEHKTVDFGKDLDNQGFVKGSYDLIIAASPFNSALNQKQQLASLRSLLRAGGYLTGLIITDEISSFNSQVSEYPFLRMDEWSSLLKASGFSEIDNEPNIDCTGHAFKFFAFVAQAIDNDVNQLQNPLSGNLIEHGIERHLLLVGDESRLSREIATLLERQYVGISSVKKLEEVVERVLPEGSTVLCFVELEEPMFKSMTRDKIQGLKILLKQAKNVLWLTTGAKEDPDLSMTRGFARSVQAEFKQLRLQFLDFGRLETPSPRLVAEHLLRLDITDDWRIKGIRQDILWTTEPEYLYENGRLQLSRILPLKEANDRQNSLHRVITKDVSLDLYIVRIVHSNSSISLEVNHECLGEAINEKVAVKVQYSTLSAVQINDDNRLFLSLGKIEKSKKPAICLSESSSSMLYLSRKFVFEVDLTPGKEAQYLSLVFNLILAKRLLDLTSIGSNLLIHEPSSSLTLALSQIACLQKRLKRVYYTTEQSETVSESIFIHNRTPKRHFKTLIPANISVFLDSSFGDEGDVASTIKECLPPSCRFLGRQSCFGPVGYFGPCEEVDISKIMELALNHLPVDDAPLSTILLPDLSNALSPDPLSVVDWRATLVVPVKTTPVASNVLFAKDKTYVLFGLTGAMGRSICEWMVAHGARYVVLSSRSPKINEAWLASFIPCGATVKVMTCDLNDIGSVRNCYDEICKTLPRIAGVAHGAMVLQDTLFAQMTPEAVNPVLEAKVNGSRHLDEIFSSHHPLDFFILFSSVVSETGSMGQTIYAAANSFLVGLASQRRKRGLTAATIVLGVVGGLGYVGEADSGSMTTAMKRNLYQISPGRMSERDVHTMFAEAVLMSGQGPDKHPVIIGGLNIVKPTEMLKPYWYENPRFQWWTRRLEASNSSIEKAKGSKSIAVQIESATTKEQSYSILRDAFFSYLELSLGIKNTTDLLLTDLDELGIDSLSALDIRSWFMMNIQADVPIMKILGGTTVGYLLDFSLGKMTPTQALTRSAQESTSEEPESPQLIPKTPVVLSTTSSEDPIRPGILRTEKLSMGQARFWFLKSYLEDKTTSNIVTCQRLSGDLRISDLAEAVRELGQRHESLRTCFFDNGDINQARQGVLESSLLRLQTLEIPTKAHVRIEYMKLLRHNYDLERGDTMRIVLLYLSSASEYYILFAYHHIIMDGMSLMVLHADLARFYQRQTNMPQMIQYPDFTTRQRREFSDGKFSGELEYWRNEFPNVPPALPLFSLSRVKTRQTLKSYRLNKVTVKLASTSTTFIKRVSRAARANVFHYYLAVFKSLVERFSNADDFCIGIADANRNDFDTVQAIGMYLNLLPLRFRANAEETFLNLLVDAKRKAQEALGHSRVPFDLLLETLDVPRSASHSPLFQAFIDYRQGYKREAPFGDCLLHELEFDAGETAYDISLDIMEDPDTESVITLKTQSSLYSQEDTEVLMKSYIHLLNAYAAEPDCPLRYPSLYSTADVQKAIEIGRGPHLSSDWAPTLSHRVDEMTTLYPTRLAIKDGLGSSLTYFQMSQRVHAIATAILDAEVEFGSKVAVFQEPTTDWVCSLLAILRTGCVYVPLDLRNPLERLSANVQAAQLTAILADDATIDDTPSLKGESAKIINVSSIKDCPSSIRRSFPNRARPESPAVILFTSGTTGTPKGIVLRHSGIRNEIEGYTKTWKIACENVLQQSAFSFDFSLDQIFSAFSTASTLYVVPIKKRGDPREIARIIATERITYTKATPSEYSSWIRYGFEDLASATSWGKAFAGGERLTDQHRIAFRSLNNPSLRLINSYGPGEISISSHKILIPYDKDSEALDVIPAGRCLPNYSVYIVDENLDAVPIGVPGEVLIGGAGPALGYLSNEVLTREKFLPNKFACAEYIRRGWTTMYRSSDKGRLGPDGELIFEGRLDGDTQIKLRGLRIELQDIESTIVRTSNGALTEAVVSLRGDPEFLVAHVVFSSNYPSERRAELIRGLKLKLPLPQYMCPARILVLDQMPLTSHLKLDRRAISALVLPSSSEAHEKRPDQCGDSELTDAESRLRDLWLAVLPSDSVEFSSIDSSTDFFVIGGNSMTVPALQLKIRQILGAVIPLFDFFESSTLKEMADRIEESKATTTIDWSHETSLSNLTIKIEEMKGITSNVFTRTPRSKIILLTGATGFLGRRILQQLLLDPDVSEINCVAVRAHSGSLQERFSIESDKIKTYDGDLNAPLLGLKEQDFQLLAGRTDAIIHSGAMRAFFETYETLRKANVESTKEIVGMALARQIPIHFISSGGLLQWDNTAEEGGSLGARSLSHIQPPIDGSDGYLATKWASESVLEKASAAYRIPIYIHRALSTDGINDSDMLRKAMQAFARLAVASGTLPDLAGWTGDFDLVPTSHVVDGVCQHLVPEEIVSRPSISFKHYPGHVKITFEQLHDFLTGSVSHDGLARMDILKWFGRIKTLGFEYIISAQNLTKGHLVSRR